MKNTNFESKSEKLRSKSKIVRHKEAKLRHEEGSVKLREESVTDKLSQLEKRTKVKKFYFILLKIHYRNFVSCLNTIIVFTSETGFQNDTQQLPCDWLRLSQSLFIG